MKYKNELEFEIDIQDNLEELPDIVEIGDVTFTMDEFDTSEGKKICKECFSKYEKLCNEKGVKFIEEQRNQEHWSHYYGTIIDHIDTYAIIGKRKIFIRGRVDRYEDKSDKAEIFNLKMQLLETDFKFMTHYCGAWIDELNKNISPIEFINWIKEKSYNFGVNYDCEIRFLGENIGYQFHGNLNKLSCAFDFRIIDKKYFEEVKKILKDPYFKNIKIKEKEDDDY